MIRTVVLLIAAVAFAGGGVAALVACWAVVSISIGFAGRIRFSDGVVPLIVLIGAAAGCFFVAYELVPFQIVIVAPS